MMNRKFESKIPLPKQEDIHGITPELKKKVEDLHFEAEMYMDQTRPDMDTFTDLYSEEEIHKNSREVSALEKEFKANETKDSRASKKFAQVAEYLVVKNMGAWTDGSVQASPASKYDDYVNGTDLILKCFPKETVETEHSTFHALKIDVVVSQLDRFIAKLTKIKKKIDEAPMERPVGVKDAPAKYFRLGEGEKWASSASAVISLTGRLVQDLVERHSNDDSSGIGRHETPYIIMTELAEQYKEFGDYAASLGKSYIAEDYAAAALNITAAFSGQRETLNSDDVLQEMIEENPSVKNQRTFFRLLREQYNPSELKEAA